MDSRRTSRGSGMRFFTPFLDNFWYNWFYSSHAQQQQLEHHDKTKLLWACCPSMAFLAAMPTAPSMFGRWLSTMVGFERFRLLWLWPACELWSWWVWALLVTSTLWMSFESTNDACSANLPFWLMIMMGGLNETFRCNSDCDEIRCTVWREKNVDFEARQDLLIHSLVPLWASEESSLAQPHPGHITWMTRAFPKRTILTRSQQTFLNTFIDKNNLYTMTCRSLHR